MWTRPVPSSVVTKSPAITGEPPLPVGQVEDRALVVTVGQGRSGELLEDLGVLAEHLLDQVLGDDQDLVAEPRAHVGDRQIHRHRWLPGSVQGVVVQTRSDSPRRPSSGKRT